MAAFFFILPAAFAAMGMDEGELAYLVFSPWFLISQQLLLLLAPLLLWVHIKRDSFANFLKNEPLDFTNVIIIVMVSLFIQPSMMFVSGLTGLFFPNVIGDVIMGIMDYPFWLVLLAIAVTPAIVEEVVFRGYIQSRYESFGIKKAAIISGLFFGIVHMNMQQFFYAFIMGIVFSYIVYYTKSIVSGILAHFIMNASQVMLLRAALLLEGLQEEIAGAYEAMDIPEITEVQAVIAVGVFALFTTPIAIFLLRSLINRCKQAHGDSLGMSNAEAVTNNMPVPELSDPEERKNPYADPFLILVVVIYAVFILT